jgi:hypothetical protein
MDLRAKMRIAELLNPVLEPTTSNIPGTQGNNGQNSTEETTSIQSMTQWETLASPKKFISIAPLSPPALGSQKAVVPNPKESQKSKHKRTTIRKFPTMMGTKQVKQVREKPRSGISRGLKELQSLEIPPDVRLGEEVRSELSRVVDEVSSVYGVRSVQSDGQTRRRHHRGMRSNMGYRQK